MTVAEAFDHFSRALATGRTANAYLVCGDIRGNALEFVSLVLHALFPDAAAQVDARCHPDVFWLEPQGKSRTIKVERPRDAKTAEGPGIRDGIVAPMATTSFSGGWKVGVVVSADRMQPAAANAFLKSLEEPSPKSMYLLITDQPDAIMPTIVSRTQRIDLPMPQGLLEGEDYEAVRELFERPAPDPFEKAQVGYALADLLDGLKKRAENEDVPIVRKAFYKTIMSFVRSWMVTGALPRHLAFRNVDAVEAAYLQSERYLSDSAVLCSMADRITWP